MNQLTTGRIIAPKRSSVKCDFHYFVGFGWGQWRNGQGGELRKKGGVRPESEASKKFLQRVVREGQAVLPLVLGAVQSGVGLRIDRLEGSGEVFGSADFYAHGERYVGILPEGIL